MPSGSTEPSRLADRRQACGVRLTRQEWYDIYKAADTSFRNIFFPGRIQKGLPAQVGGPFSYFFMGGRRRAVRTHVFSRLPAVIGTGSTTM